MKILMRLLAFLLAVVVVVFTVNNMVMAPVDLWPLRQVSLPVWAIAWIGIVLGLVLGFLIAWFSFGKLRRRNRSLLQRIENDQREMAMLRRQVEKAEAKGDRTTLSLPAADAA